LEWGLKAVCVETIHAFQYMAWVPALLGLWWFRERLRSSPVAWLMLIFSGGIALLLVRVALGVHYLSERHTLIFVLCASFWAAAALIRLAEALPGWIEARRGRTLPVSVREHLPIACLIIAVTWCLPQSLKPLHANRAGHRAAGEWLATHLTESDL